MKTERVLVACAVLAALPLAVMAQEAAAPAPETPAMSEALAPTAPVAAPDQATAEAEYLREAQTFYETLNRQTGIISVAQGRVAINVPETHYFVGAEDARRIIVDIWGNPPNSAEGVDGIIFLSNTNPMLGAWGALVQYVHEGHVPDDDARTIDYTQLLRDMQSGAEQENAWRRENNYPTIQIVGWAEAPHYDEASHKLYWAKELAFSESPLNTLNYDIRVLGREGHLVLSFVAMMDELALIHTEAPVVMEMANFTAGNAYADYVEGADQRATYGIGGLIAGGALAAGQVVAAEISFTSTRHFRRPSAERATPFGR
jgi:uncharacterized membrane-anchored protein